MYIKESGFRWGRWGGGGGRVGDKVLGERRCLFVGCLTSQQHASVSQGRICSDDFTCCYTEIEAADPTFYLTQSLYTDTGTTSPSADPSTPLECQFWSHWYDLTPKKSRRKRDSNPESSALEADALTTRPTRRLGGWGGGGRDVELQQTLTNWYRR